jgi:hypothetical protein
LLLLGWLLASGGTMFSLTILLALVFRCDAGVVLLGSRETGLAIDLRKLTADDAGLSAGILQRIYLFLTPGERQSGNADTHGDQRHSARALARNHRRAGRKLFELSHKSSPGFLNAHIRAAFLKDIELIQAIAYIFKAETTI